MKTLSALALLLSASLLGCTSGDADADVETDDFEQTQSLALAVPETPSGQAVARIYQDALRTEGRITQETAHQLAAFLQAFDGKPSSVRPALESLASDPARPLDDAARALLKDALAGRRSGSPGLENAVFRLALGTKGNSVTDDAITLVGPGSVSGDTGLLGHSRGYAKYADGVLRKTHGSRAPSYASGGASTKLSPGKALDAAARTFGLDLGTFGFDYLAETVHYNPNAPYWAGLCHAWSYTSLDDRLNALVEVPGPEGKRGLWLFGQFWSRADLGNWLMGVANSLSIADAELVDSFVEPEDLLKGFSQYVLNSEHGMRADVWNDAEKGHQEIWNQPFYAGELAVEVVTPKERDAVIAHAKANPKTAALVPADANVRLVRMRGLWGAEVSDSHEGAVELGESRWNMYVVTDGAGKVTKGFMAHHLAAKNLGLQETKSDALPDYFAFPKHALVDAALDVERGFLLDDSNDGKFYRFFVGTVLARGIPDTTRAAFEREAKGANLDAKSLAARFPGVANAYTREQWQAAFASRLGDGEAFGARWGDAKTEFTTFLAK
jgi:hypothetical protein